MTSGMESLHLEEGGRIGAGAYIGAATLSAIGWNYANQGYEPNLFRPCGDNAGPAGGARGDGARARNLGQSLFPAWRRASRPQGTGNGAGDGRRCARLAS